MADTFLLFFKESGFPANAPQFSEMPGPVLHFFLQFWVRFITTVPKCANFLTFLRV